MKVVNTYKKIRDNWYSWTVSIQGTDEELGQIKKVTYLLHETFPNRRIVSKSSSDNFARTISGWGEFLLRAEAEMKNGEINHAELWLDLGFEHIKEEKQKYTGRFNMSLIILQKNPKDPSNIEVQNKLKYIIDDPLTVVMLVYGDNEEIKNILGLCVSRASVKSAIRRVVWIPDDSVLSQEQISAFRPKNKVVVTIGLNDEVADTLTANKAKFKIKIEKAFLRAEAQGEEE